MPPDQKHTSPRPCAWCGAEPKSTLGSLGGLWVECMTEECPLFWLSAKTVDEWNALRPVAALSGIDQPAEALGKVREALALAAKMCEGPRDPLPERDTFLEALHAITPKAAP